MISVSPGINHLHAVSFVYTWSTSAPAVERYEPSRTLFRFHERDIIINFNMHKCIQNNHINVILYRYIRLAYCRCCCCSIHVYVQFAMAMTDNACSRGIDEFIAILQSTTQVMTNIQCILNTSSYVALWPYLKSSTHMPPIFTRRSVVIFSLLMQRVCVFVCFFLHLYSSIFVLSILLAFSIFCFYRRNFHAFLFAFQSSSPTHSVASREKISAYSIRPFVYICRHNFWHLLQ